jgi:transglutaminase-like putative cysteine protease
MKKICSFIILVFLVIVYSESWAESISGEIIMDFDLSAHTTDKEVQIWLPYPVSDSHQHISNIHVEGDYSEYAVYTDRKFQTPILYARWENGSKTRKLTFSFTAKRREITRHSIPSKMVAWDPSDYALYLAPNRLGPVDGDVKKLADDITEGKNTLLEKAKAVYDWTCENTYRNPKTRGCGEGNVCLLLNDPGGKCADINSIFVALAKAAGIPSREMFGIRQGKKSGQDITTWYHCWAEFYLPGNGWIPVDPADVRKMMLKKNLTLSSPETAEYRDYFWGGIDAYRVKLSTGRDMTLNPAQAGQPVNYLMYPFAQVGEKTLDWLDPETFQYKITYRQ